MNLKSEITQKLIQTLGLEQSEKFLKKYHKVLWVNPRNKEKGGLKLTDVGFEQMNKADIKHHKVRLENELDNTNQTILKLDQFIDCPWYLDKRHIYVYSDKIAVQLILFSGNLKRFIEAKLRSQNVN
jgi:hypothetical protein